VWAHKPSDSYLMVDVHAARIDGRWDIALRDLDAAIGLDTDGNGELTWGEVSAHHEAVAAYALSRLAITGDGRPCRLEAGEQLIDHHTDGAYTVLRFHATCGQTVRSLGIDYRLLFDIDPQHKGLLRLEQAGKVRTAIFGSDRQGQQFALGASSWLAQLGDYLNNGVWHIWIGFDHILFLLSLLLPAVLLRRDGKWLPAPTFRVALVDVIKIVSAFTLAHSITLTLATLQFVVLPSRWVESCIAASVVIAALNNLWPLAVMRRWMAAFAFGLLHGFGFASVLADLGLARDTLALALVGFNVGVELGQLAIVAVFLPLAYALRATVFYRRGVMAGGSAGIAMLALVWFVERAFNLSIGTFVA
jgi:hypothetical protein